MEVGGGAWRGRQAVVVGACVGERCLRMLRGGGVSDSAIPVSSGVVIHRSRACKSPFLAFL